MTILLIGINAKYIHSNPAIYSLKAYADKYYSPQPNHGILEIAEYTVNQSPSVILADIYQKRPQAAAFSCYIWNWNIVKELLVELPKLLPETELWLGGPEVSFHAEKIMQAFPQLAGIMVGEGEETFLELLHYYWEKTISLSSVKGIVCKDGFTGERALTDIGKLPFLYNPYLAVGKADSENNTLACFKNRILYYESQRGCPFQCAYCLSAIDKTVRLRDINIVKSELQYLLDCKVPQVKFVDRTFNCNQAHALSIWQYLLENDNCVTNFHFEIAADLLTAKQIELLRNMRPGLIQLEIGIQSTNQTTLKAVNRHTNMEALRKNIMQIHSFQNIHQHLDLIAGLPYEDYDSFVHSFNDVYAMAPDQLQLGFLKVLKGSPIEQHTAEYGIVYQSKPPYEVLYTKWLSYEELLKLKNIAEMVEIYYNSGQFSHIISVLQQEFISPFHLFAALTDYYNTNGYFISTPSRSYRYQIILEFACSIASDKRELYIELLTFDLYLRENLKSRPNFSPENRTDRQKLNRFYIQEAQAPNYLKGYSGYTSAQLLRMTHVECFLYPVWKELSEDCTKKLQTPAYILFDYHKRNPLTHNATFHEIIL